MYTVCMQILFADAKPPEDLAEDFVVGDVAGYGAKVVEGGAEVFRQEVGSETKGDPILQAEQGIRRISEGFIMPTIGDYR